MEADLLTSRTDNNPNCWLVAIASLIVKKLIKVILFCMNIHLICKNTPQFSQFGTQLVFLSKYEEFQSFIRNFDITFAPFNYLTIGSIFRGFTITECFLYLYSIIMSLVLRSSVLEKRWTLLSLKLEASPTTSVRSVVCETGDSIFDSITKL